MALPIPEELIDFLLLGPLDDRRQLQDSPILADVWIEYAGSPCAPLDLLISPYLHENAGKLAAMIHDELVDDLAEDEDAEVAHIQGLVAARLTFQQLLRHVVPKTSWWSNQWERDEVGKEAEDAAEEAAERRGILRLLADEDGLASLLGGVFDSARRWNKPGEETPTEEIASSTRFLALAGLLCWAADAPAPEDDSSSTPAQRIAHILTRVTPSTAVARRLHELGSGLPADVSVEGRKPAPLVYLVARNRSATLALEKSVPAVKADAAHMLFKVECRNIAWAVLDSGIDGRHPAFLAEDGKTSRIRASYDFRNFRKIVSLGNSRAGIRKRNVGELLGTAGLVDPPTAEQAEKDLKRLAEDARSQAPVHWEVIEPYVRIDPKTPPPSPHGSHVAGILGARKAGEGHDGMCPDVGLYDFRILAPNLKDTEFAIIAAMQFIRYINERGSLKAIQGANLSLSIPHNVRNFACGRTPICNECEGLIDSGVVVVAAAGNHGYKNFQTQEGLYAGYAAFSITDPGNADGVITVGATHRFWPHTYGVSFFSSRGPTGDGRVKPDLVAPGERIRAPLEGDGNGGGTWGDLDGTSMAAPHVSGAAAMLMARYTELIGQPRRIKQILCDSATDLGRERTFQGRGMLDVLRAFQSL